MPSEPLVVAFVDSRYRPLLEIWLHRMVVLGIRRVRIYALDTALLDWCRSQGVDAVHVPWRGDLRDLWVQRIRIFGTLLAQGEVLIHSDVDALWLRDPRQERAVSEPVADLAFTQGTVWPPDVHARWGFVLCCGWFLARPTHAARHFLALLEKDVAVSGDDQVSVNRVLSALGIVWERAAMPDYLLEFQGKSLQCWTQPMHGVTADASLRIALLPHREYQRLPEPFGEALVKHYLTPKRCEDKLAVFRLQGLIA